MENEQLKYIVEAALLAAARPLDLATLQSLFGDEDPPERDDLRAAIVALQRHALAPEIHLFAGRAELHGALASLRRGLGIPHRHD